MTRAPFQARDVSVAIPTYERGAVLLETVRALLEQQPGEILALDQTPAHPPDVEAALEGLAREGRIRWERLPRPAIPPAMNAGLLRATRPLVLFLDDDIVPAPGLVAAHAAGYERDATWAVAGQVLQPGEEPMPPRACRTQGFRAHLDFSFRSSERALITNGMAGNLSVLREQALQVGGFDENFEGAAYRFETEFCRRLCRGGGEILFEPAASMRHLRAARGGTRAQGGHLGSASPSHGVGDYYFALRSPGGLERWAYLARRPLREVATRFHLRHPWFIPVKLLGELRALLWAARLARRPPKLVVGSAARVSTGARTFYERRARADGWARPAGARSEKPLLLAFVEQHQLERARVLEVGCGTCDFQGLVDGWVGVDLALSAGRFAVKPVAVASAQALPFKSASFDAVWTVAVLEHVPDPEASLADIARVLRPGGLALLAPAWHCRPWAAEGLHVRPWSDLGWRQRLVKASIPLREALWFRAALALPIRLWREARYTLAPARALRLRYGRLRPNYEHFWASDSDACSALDPHETLLWFLSRGWSSVTHTGRSARLAARHEAVVVRKP